MTLGSGNIKYFNAFNLLRGFLLLSLAVIITAEIKTITVRYFDYWGAQYTKHPKTAFGIELK